MCEQATSQVAPLDFAKQKIEFSQPRLLLADDHDMMLERVLSLLHHYRVVGTAHNGRDLVTKALQLQPDLIVLDITMPILNGIDAVHELHEAGSTAKFVFLTIHQQPAFVDACFAEGALGYVTKSHLGTDLLPAVNAALAGCRFISPSLPR